MKKVKKLSGALALALTLAMSCMNAQTVMAADSTMDSAASDSNSSSSDSTSNDSTSSDSTSDDNASDDSTSDDSTSNDSTSNDGTSDNNTSDDSTPDDSASDDGTSDNSTFDDITSDDSVSDDSTTDDSTSDDDASDDNISDSGNDSVDVVTTIYNNSDVDSTNVVVLSDDDDDNLQDASIYLSKSSLNKPDNTSDDIVITLNSGNEPSRIFKINLTGAHFYNGNHLVFTDGEDLTSWCNQLPDGLKLVKYSDNTGASYGRVKIIGTTTASGDYSVAITVPRNYLKAYSGYKISDDGLTVSFTINVDGVSVPVTVPVEEILSSGSSKHDHSEKKVVESDYAKFCKDVAVQILAAQENGSVTVSTDKWVSFDETVYNALQTRSDVSLTLDFVYEGKGYETVISAGTARNMVTTPIESETIDLFDEPTPLAAMPTTTAEAKYFGFMYLGSVYGLNDMAE